jgi:superfamily II DNA or RNA helicase
LNISSSQNQIKIEFEEGTILVKQLEKSLAQLPEQVRNEFSSLCVWDDRLGCFRALAFQYARIVLILYKNKIDYIDFAKQFEPTAFQLVKKIDPRSHQQQALEQWLKNGKRGVCVLPTGAGKTILACLVIEKCNRPTLIHVPTIDLLHQWKTVLTDFFGIEIGAWGGGFFDTQQITVTTYDSALIHEKKAQQKFGLIVFDECHHLPGELTKRCAVLNLAPFRLGLTATLEREDGKHLDLLEYVGKTCYEIDIKELAGNTLSEYETHTIAVNLSATEKLEYQNNYSVYKNFLIKSGVQLGGLNGWQNFIQVASRTAEGRQAHKSFLNCKNISYSAIEKIEKINEILIQHFSERILVFTQDNFTAYKLGALFLFPVLTHHTKGKERENMLKLFRSGDYRVLITSKVLNEGVDVPEASVAIVVSGSGTVREHVQRLGRVLRSQPEKKARLYELVTVNTSETFTSEKRKQHSAYQTNH